MISAGTGTSAMSKIRVATTSLAGCFGCHMSLLDIDERILELVELVEFDATPLTDFKRIEECDVGIVEGGVCNEENIEVLKEFRANSRILVGMGACALNGGVPAMRNHYTLEECLEVAFISGDGIENPQIPSDPDLPLLLDKVHPIHEVVKVDYFLPGCPPSADTIWLFLDALLHGKPIDSVYSTIQYD